MKAQNAKRFALLDTKGFAKPEKFTGAEESFLYCRARVVSFLISLMPDLEELLESVEEPDSEITRADLEAAWSATNPVTRPSQSWARPMLRSSPCSKRFVNARRVQ